MAVCRHPVSVSDKTEQPILFAHLFARQGQKIAVFGVSRRRFHAKNVA
jgi:hypothetical protein